MPRVTRPDRGQTIRTGIAGEFFVAGELSKRGWIATLTAKNTPDVDVLVSRPTGDTHARIQVKTRSPAYAYAHRVGRELKLVGDRDFLVLVDLGAEGETPRYWVIPTGIAARLIKNEQIRTSDVSEFEGRWDLLDNDAVIDRLHRRGRPRG
jgi:hypothetical protein